MTARRNNKENIEQRLTLDHRGHTGCLGHSGVTARRNNKKHIEKIHKENHMEHIGPQRSQNTKKAHRLKSEQPAEATKCEQRNIKGTKPLQQK